MTSDEALKKTKQALEGMVPDHMESVFQTVATLLKKTYLKGWSDAMDKAHWASWDIS